MTAAAYNLEHRWDIPAYIWPGVLGLSVALHLAFLLFGLPSMPWTAAAPEEPPEIEVVLEAGGPVFEETLPVVPPALDLADAGQTEQLEASPPEVTPLPQDDAGNQQVLQSAPVQVEQVPVAQLTTVEALVLPQAEPEAADVIVAEEVTALQPEEVLQAPVPTLEAAPLETVDVPQVDEILVPEAVSSNPIPVDVVEPETVVPAVEALPAIPVVTPQESAPVPLISAEQREATVSDEAVVTEITPLAEDVAPVTDIGPEAVPLQTAQEAVDLTSGAVAVTEVAPLAPSAQQVVPGLAPGATPEALPPEPGSMVVTPNETITLTPVETPDIATIVPETQQLAEVAPEETEVAALAPTEPETSVVPSVEEPSTPADIVPPVEVATIDPLANITTYVKNYDFGDCAHLSVLSAGADSAQVTAFGTGIGAFAVFDQRFKAEQGFEASIQLRLVTEKQCALLNALGVSQGVEAAGLVELDKTVVKSGTLTTGQILRDLPVARIAAAEQAGLDLGGKGPPELYLIDDAGQIHDGRDFLLPASSATTAGAWRFKVPVVMMSGSDQETALVLAIWNRPASRQPPRFGTLPPSRVSAVLAEPGVYSLAAFKVSR